MGSKTLRANELTLNQCWKFTEAPSPVFQAGISDTGTHMQLMPCEEDISTTAHSSCTHVAWAVTGPAAAMDAWTAWRSGNPTSAITQAKAPCTRQARTNAQRVARQ